MISPSIPKQNPNQRKRSASYHEPLKESSPSNHPTRPPLRYFGSKWKLAPWIISHLPEHKNYVEPFMGGAGVLLRKPRSHHEVLGDVDDEIVNLFRVLRDRGREFARKLTYTPFSRTEYSEAFSPSKCPVDRARKTVIRSLLGFGGSGIFRKSGFRWQCRTTTSFANGWRTLPSHLDAVVERLRGVILENRPALELIEMHDRPETLFYCDPPYLAETREAKSVYRHEMSTADHVALLGRLKAAKGAVVLSGYASPLYDGLLKGWKRVKMETLADAGKRAHGARKRLEVLWIKSPALR